MTAEHGPQTDNPVEVVFNESGSEFDRFHELTRRLVAVPKSEIDEKRDAAKNGNGP
jgi:hypothetical protein